MFHAHTVVHDPGIITGENMEDIDKYITQEPFEELLIWGPIVFVAFLNVSPELWLNR